ncbi:MAG: pectate lyase, partial [Prosthecobacter sp.]
MRQLTCVFFISSAMAADLPDPAQISSAMKKAVTFAHTHLAREGGYASSYDKVGKMGETEHNQSPTVISIQPPGTTTIGLAMLRAYRATGEELFLRAARDAAGALIQSQLVSGGWDSDFDFNPEKMRKYHLRTTSGAPNKDKQKLRNVSTLDDNKTQSALLLLLEVAHESVMKNDTLLQEAKKTGFDALLSAQTPNGGWPQQFRGPSDDSAPVKKADYPSDWSRVFPKLNYADYYTLNDGNLSEIAKLLIRAHRLEKDDRYLAALRRLGDF